MNDELPTNMIVEIYDGDTYIDDYDDDFKFNAHLTDLHEMSDDELTKRDIQGYGALTFTDNNTYEIMEWYVVEDINAPIVQDQMNSVCERYNDLLKKGFKRYNANTTI